MSSRRLPPRSSTTLDPKTPTPSSSSQQLVSELSDQLTPRLSTSARTTTRSGQTPSSRRQPARTPTAVASTSKLTREGAPSTGPGTGKGKGRAAELRTEEGGGGGEGGRRSSTPSRRRAQPSTNTPSTSTPVVPPQRQTRSQSTQSISTSSEQEEVSQSEEDDEQEELEEVKPNERESAFHAAAAALHDFYISAPAGREINRPTEELLFGVLSSHKSFLFPSATLSYILPSTLPPTTSPYLRSAVALANKATLLHAVLLPSTAGTEKERVDAFEEAWEAFVQVWAADKEEGLQVHDGVLVLMVDFGTQLYILKNPGNLNASDRDSLLWDYFSSTLLSRQGVLSVDREDGLRSQLQMRWKSLSQERVRKLQNTPTADLPTTFSYFDFERELINSCRARRRLDARGRGGGSSLLLEEEEHQVPLREEEEEGRPIKRARKSEPAPPRRLTTSTSLSVSARKPSNPTSSSANAAASRRRSLPTNLAATSSNASTFQLLSPRPPQGSYPLPPIPPATAARRRSSGPRYSVMPVRQEDLTSGSESEASASGDEPEPEEEKDPSSSASEDEPEPEPVEVVGSEPPSSEESGSEESASGSEEEEEEEEEGEGEGEATPRPPRRVVAEVEVAEESESEEDESESEEEGLEETEELVGLEDEAEEDEEEDEEEPGLGVGARGEMEVDREQEELEDEDEEDGVVVEDEGVVVEMGEEEETGFVRGGSDLAESVLAVNLGEEDWDAVMAQAAEEDALRRLSLPPSERNPSLAPLDKGKGRAEPRLPFVAAPALDDYNDMNDNDFQPYDPQPSPPPQRLPSSSTRQTKPHPPPKKPRPSKRQNTFDDDPSDDDDDAEPPQGLKKTPLSTRILPSAPSTSAWAVPTDRRPPSASSSTANAAFPTRIRHRSISSSIDPMLIQQRVLVRKEREREEEERRRVEEERRAEYFGDEYRGKSRERGEELEDRETGGYWDQEELAFFLEEAMMLSPRETQPWDKLISLYGPNGTENTNLRRRTNVNLKDKMRNYLHANYPSSGTKPVLGPLMRFLSRDDPRRIAWLEEEEKKKNPELPALWQKKKSGGQPRKSTRWKGKGKKKEVTVHGVVDSDEEEELEGNELEDVEEEEQEPVEEMEEEEDGDEGEEELVEEAEEQEVPRRRTKRATARKGVVAS